MPLIFTTEVHIAASPERVFQALTDLDGARHWMQGLVDMEKTTDGPFGVGTRWKETRRMYGKNATEHFEVTSCEAPEKLMLRVDGSKGSTGKGEYRFDYVVSPEGDQSHVAVSGLIDLPGLFPRLFGRLFIGSFKRAIYKDLHAMKAYVEEQSAPANG
ncbi:MAG: SRPBCC family protein [Dehalococcoidia bacterium]